jgi:hypothetical protein
MKTKPARLFLFLLLLFFFKQKQNKIISNQIRYLFYTLFL